MAVLPVAIPETLPELLTVAIPSFELLHTPPDIVSFKLLVVCGHRTVSPFINPATGSGLILIVALLITEPQLLVTL